MRLAELQAAFQSAVLSGAGKDPAVLASLTKPAARERATGFGVYVKAYRLRVAEYLEEDFPALKSLLGDKRFQELVVDYVAANPSRTRNARYFSARLPDFMEESEKWRGEAQARGVARLERALSDAFDAADGEACALETLAAYAPQDWPRLVFAFHPSSGSSACLPARSNSMKRSRPKAPRRGRSRATGKRRRPSGARVSTRPIGRSRRTSFWR